MTNIPIPQEIRRLKMKPHKIKEAWDKYVAVNKKYINRTIFYNEVRNQGMWDLRIPLRDAKEDCGRKRIDKKEEWIWLVFIKIYPFFRIHQRGNSGSGEISEVIPIKDRFAQIAAETTIFEKYFEGLTEADIAKLDMVPVDEKSLRRFIQHGNPNDIKRAKIILAIGQECQSVGMTPEAMLPYESERKPFGRTYHQGINLQSSKRRVREAALGDCWEYDMNAGVVAVKLTILEAIYDTTGNDFDTAYPAAKDYVKNKTKIRKQLTDVLYNARLARNQSQPATYAKPTKAETLDNIKTVFTAISFGADINTKGWWYDKTGNLQSGAFTSIIPDKTDRDTILNAIGGFLRQFVDEQTEMTALIVDDFLADKSKKTEVAEMRQAIGKRLYKSKAMAYIYQHRETEIMDRIEAGIMAQLGTNPIILRVHDGFYSSKRIPMAMIQGILDKIQYANCKDFRGYITVSEEPINP